MFLALVFRADSQRIRFTETGWFKLDFSKDIWVRPVRVSASPKSSQLLRIKNLQKYKPHTTEERSI